MKTKDKVKFFHTRLSYKKLKGYKLYLWFLWHNVYRDLDTLHLNRLRPYRFHKLVCLSYFQNSRRTTIKIRLLSNNADSFLPVLSQHLCPKVNQTYNQSNFQFLHNTFLCHSIWIYRGSREFLSERDYQLQEDKDLLPPWKFKVSYDIVD